MIYSLFIFDKHCNCIFVKTWPQNINNTVNNTANNGGHFHKGSESRAVSYLLPGRFTNNNSKNSSNLSSSVSMPANNANINLSPTSNNKTVSALAASESSSSNQNYSSPGSPALSSSTNNEWSFRHELSGHQRQSSISMIDYAGTDNNNNNNNNNSNNSNNSFAIPTTATSSSTNKQHQDLLEQSKLIFGVIYSLRNFVQKLAVTSGKNNIKYSSNVAAFKTSKYKLHHYLTASGLTLILLTDPKSETLLDVLHGIYANVYVKSLVKQPGLSKEQLADPTFVQSNAIFNEALEKYIRSLPQFSGY